MDGFDAVEMVVGMVVAVPFVIAALPFVGAYYGGKYLYDHRPDLQLITHTKNIEDGK